MLFVINYNSEIQCTTPPPRFSTATSLLTHPQLCLVFIFLCHIRLPHRAILLGFFSLSFLLLLLSFRGWSEIIKIWSTGWARREQTQARVCLFCSRGE